MKKLFPLSLSLILLTLLTSCEAINTIFKAGMWWGIILVVGVAALVIWILSRVFGRKD